MITSIEFLLFIPMAILLYILFIWKNIYTKNALYLNQFNRLGWEINFEVIPSRTDSPIIINSKKRVITIYNNYNPHVLEIQLRHLLKSIQVINQIPDISHSQKLIDAYNEINECFSDNE